MKRRGPNHQEIKEQYDFYNYAHGKLLISGEYFALDGAHVLALPTTVGQSLAVKYKTSFGPVLHWKSYDMGGKLWFEEKFEFWRFNILNENPCKRALFLQKILRQVRKQNLHFLRDDVDVLIETRLGFPLDWGLGSSSTLIYNLAKFAYIGPFELLFESDCGSGYDIACAQSEGPILYNLDNGRPNWSIINFDPPFKEMIYFVHLGKKQDSRKAIEYFKLKRPFDYNVIKSISDITHQMAIARELKHFELLMLEHEKIVAKNLNLTMIKEDRFSDYWGEIKSLGAWGGDFVMVTSDRSSRETQEYFFKKGLDVFIPYCELILNNESLPITNSSKVEGL